MNIPFAFHDLPEESFPFWMVTYDKDTGVPINWWAVHEPGAVKVPGKPEGVREIGVFMRFGDGMEIDK